MTLAKTWSNEDTQLAIEMWKDGNSAGMIAQALDYRHTRNAVLGKIHKLGLSRTGTKGGKYKTKPQLSKPDAEEIIVERFAKGGSPSDIGHAIKISTAEVRLILQRLGYDDTENTMEGRMHPMWSMEEDARRQAFYDKFSEGWKEVLERLADGS